MSGLTVFLNRAGLNTVETDRTTVQATESVRVVLENHGKPTHVHLHLDDDLATLATIEDPHWFVPEGEARELTIRLSEAAAGRGRLEIATGYGQNRTTVDVEVTRAGDQDSESTDRDVSGPEATTETRATGGADSTGTAVDPIPNGTRLGSPAFLAGAGVVLLIGLLLIIADPFVAVSAGLVAVLSGIAVASYVRERPDSPREP